MYARKRWLWDGVAIVTEPLLIIETPSIPEWCWGQSSAAGGEIRSWVAVGSLVVSFINGVSPGPVFSSLRLHSCRPELGLRLFGPLPASSGVQVLLWAASFQRFVSLRSGGCVGVCQLAEEDQSCSPDGCSALQAAAVSRGPQEPP